jgi:hypothetical protein
MRAARLRRAGAVLAVLAAWLLAGCGSQASVDPSSLGIPDAPHPPVLGTATYHTSPDGGIYDNPDPLRVTLVGRIPLRGLAANLGAQRQWASLAPFGALTVVGFQIRNAGLAGSDPQLDELQIASSLWSTCAAGGEGALCPRGVSRATFDRFYYPAFPLAGLSTVKVGSQCQIHIDPGQTVTVVLVYPPIRSTTYLTWGEYGTFALELSLGGGIPPTGDLTVGLCEPPQVQPT